MERTELGKLPIDPEKPAGQDVKYEPEFDELQSEIDKLTSLTGGAPDWPKVVRLSEKILASMSKDIKVTAYLCAGLLQTEGVKGLAQGLAVCEDLLSNFWEDMFPPKKRMRGRIGALTWLANRLGHDLEGLELPLDQAGDAQACKQALEDLAGRTQELLGNKSPNFKPVIRIMRLWPEPEVETAEPEPVEKKEAAQPPSRPKPAPEAPKISIDDLTSAAEIQKALRDQLTILRRLAGRIIDQTPTSSMPYHLLFQSIWVMIEAPPPSQDGKTRIPPPAQTLIDRLKGLEAKGAWSELLKESLTRIAETPLWLDLARYIWAAANNQGEEWRLAAQAVRQETGIFIERIPALQSLTFSDGTPLADDRTRKWLESILSGTSTTSTGPEASPEPGKPKAPCIKYIGQAEEISRSGDLKKALELLSSLSCNTAAHEESFRYKLAMARLCMEADRYAMAEPILASLAEDSERFHLEEWQPSLAAEAIYQFYMCEKGLIKKQNPTPEQRERIKKLYDRLCRLDPVAALGIG